MPAGWSTAAAGGGAEAGFRGNGTWVHARDARYVAQDVIGVGCAPVTRDDYTDPTNALEASYRNAAGKPGVGVVLKFATSSQAQSYFTLYRRQVAACTSAQPVQATVLASPTGLVDQRTYDDQGDWTEMGHVVGDRVTLVMLTDPGHKISVADADAVLAQSVS